MVTRRILLVYMEESAFQYISGQFDRFITNLGGWVTDHGFAIALIILCAWLAKRYGAQFISRIFHKTIRADLYPTKSDRIKRLETIDSITNAILQVLVVVIAAIMIIAELGINTAPLLASAGVIGLALGVGAQSLIKDLASGAFIILDNQYRVGDVVKLDNISGVVESISIRTTVLRGLDGTLYHVPNGSITTTANMTMNYGGIEEDIVFDSNVDIAKLAIVIDRAGRELAQDPAFSSKVIEAPHFLRIVGFTPDGIKVKILGRTTPNESWEIRGEFYKRLITELRKANIQVPATQITITQASAKKSDKKKTN